MSTGCTSQSLKTSSQYLSQIRPWPPGPELLPFGSRQHPINLKHLQMLLTQSVYLIFHLHSTHPLAKSHLSRRLWLDAHPQEEDTLTLILVTEDEVEDKKGKQKEMLLKFIQQECTPVPGANEQEVVTAMRSCIQACLECYKQSRAKGFLLASRLNEAIIKTEMDEFCYVYYTVLSPKLALGLFARTSLLRALEETRLFRENALLLKYSNHSLLARTLPQKSKKQLAVLSEDFSAERKLFLKDPTGRVQFSEQLVEKFLIVLSKGNVITFNVSVNDTPQSKPQESKSSKVGRVVSEHSKENRAIVFSLNVEELPYQFLTPQRLDYLLANPDLDRFPPEEKPTLNKRINQFELRYNALANQVEVKMLTGHPVRPQEMDLIAAVLASLSGALPEVDYSFEESRRAKNNDKCIALRTRTQLHPKECPFSCLLENVDRLIADSLVIQHDLRVRKIVGERRREQISEIGQYMLERVRNLLDVFWGGESIL